jgi:hypothetical protein
MRVRRAEISGDEVWAVRWMRRQVYFIGTHLSGEVDNDEGAEKHADNSNNSWTRHTTDAKTI